MLKLDWCSTATARYAVERWHYSKTLSSAKNVYIGVWEDERFIGVVVFGIGAGNVTNGLRFGLSRTSEVAELARVALRDHKAPVSRVVSIATKMVHRQSPGIRLLISFADPKQGHYGGIYQALGWVYTGVTKADVEYFYQNEWRHHRTVTSSGSAAGLPSRLLPSKHRYLFVLDESLRAQIKALSQPYPKRDPSRENAAAPPSAEGGVIPTGSLQLWSDDELEAEGALMFRPVDISTQPRLDRLAPGDVPDDGLSLFDDLQDTHSPEPQSQPAGKRSPSLRQPGPSKPPPRGPSALVFAGTAAPLGLPATVTLSQTPPAQPEPPLAPPSRPESPPDDLAPILAHLASIGCVLSSTDGRLFVSNASRLSDLERAEIQRLKPALIASLS